MKKKRWSREYFRCSICGGVALDKKFFTSPDEQHERYLMHRNFLCDEGYFLFLLDFLQNVFSFSSGKNMFSHGTLSGITDYGSGPNPALVSMLGILSAFQRNIASGRSVARDLGCTPDCICRAELAAASMPLLPSSENISGWDPFFAPERPGHKSDLLLCLEVAEHFEQPDLDFSNLVEFCNDGGIVALGTLPVPDFEDFQQGFSGWWYKDDFTHVSFYTEAAASSCGSRAGLDYLGMASERIFMFQKKAARFF